MPLEGIRSIATSIIALVLLTPACATAVTPSPAASTTTPSPLSTLSPSATPSRTANPSPSVAASPTATPSPAATSNTAPDLSAAFGSGERIVFFRTNADRSVNTPFVINPDGSGETQLSVDLPTGIWSPDHSRLMFAQLVPDASPKPGAESAWIRPATINVDGSGFKVLDAYPNRKMQLAPAGWSADGSRIYASSGGEDVDPADQGFYAMRNSDGGDLSRVLVTAPPPGYDQGFAVAPDGSQLMVINVLPRQSLPDLRTLSVAKSDGTEEHQLNAPDANVIDLEFFGGASWTWSPVLKSLREIAFCAFVNSGTGESALFTVNSDGTHLKEIVPPEIGAVSAQWSPNGKLIAFSSELGRDNQIWVVNSDGSGARQLTNNVGGSVSIVPVWSPDGTRLLFQRKDAGQVTLWTMTADGADQMQLSPTPLAADWIGPYAWWPAP